MACAFIYHLASTAVRPAGIPWGSRLIVIKQSHLTYFYVNYLFECSLCVWISITYDKFIKVITTDLFACF